MVRYQDKSPPDINLPTKPPGQKPPKSKPPGQKTPRTNFVNDKTFLPWISLLLFSSLIKTKFPRIIFIEKAFLHYSSHPSQHSQARAGHQPAPQRRRYLDSNQRIKNIVQDYHNRDIMQYLRGLAHNISMWRTIFLMFRFYTNPNNFFKNHQPTRGYTGNHCTISKLCTWETMKM